MCSAWPWQGKLSERWGALAALSPCCPSESQPRIDLAGCSNPLFLPSRLLQAFLSAPSQLALICAPSAPACASKPRPAIIPHRHCHRSSLPRRCKPPHLSSAASLPGATSNLTEPHGLLRSSFTFPSFTRPCPQTSPIPFPQGVTAATGTSLDTAAPPPRLLVGQDSATATHQGTKGAYTELGHSSRDLTQFYSAARPINQCISQRRQAGQGLGSAPRDV